MRRAPALKLFYALEFALAMPTWIVVSVYLVRDLHLSPLQLVLMGTAMEAAVFASEIPTGVVADTYSRRLSLVVGWLGMGASWLGVGLVHSGSLAIALWACWGVSYTFTSGAYEAWLADEIGPSNLGPALLRGARVGFVGSLVGLAALVALGTWSVRAAVVAGGAITIACGLAAAVLMPETGFVRRRRHERAPLATALAGVRFVRSKRLLVLLVASEVFAGASSEAYDRLRDAHLIRDFGVPGLSPVVWFGIVGAAVAVFGFFAVGRLLRRVERGGTREVVVTLVALLAVVFAAELAFAFAGVFGLAIAMVVVIGLARALIAPLFTVWLNEQVTDSSVRATVFSIAGQADAVGQAAGGPVLGALGNARGLRTALATGALILLPALGFYARGLRHSDERDVVASPQAT